MADAGKRNQSLMQWIRRVHGLVETPDLEKKRQSQDHLGVLLGSREVKYQELEIDGMHGEWVRGERNHLQKHVILYFHGGGFSSGSSVYARALTGKLAASVSMDVLCVDYRLAPEHRFPAALEDAVKAWEYLMLLGYGAGEVILAGDSAGGNLALVLTLKLKESGRFLPRGLVLMSPWTDLTSSGRSFHTRAELDPVLNGDYIREMTMHYAGEEDLRNPLLSPVFGNFTGFPPTYIQVGENEILLSDSLRLYRAMSKANVLVRLDRFPGMWHVFQMSPFKAANEAMERNAEFIFEICR